MTSPAVVRAVVLVVRGVLLLYPPRFRTAFGPEILSDIRHAVADACRLGPWAGVRAALAALGHTAAGVLPEWVRTRRRRERSTDSSNGDAVMTQLWADLRLGGRRLVLAPTFTVAVVLTLAIGIGLNTAMFTLVKGVILDPLPYPQPDALVSVYTRYLPSTGHDFPYFALSGPELLDVRKEIRSLSVSAYIGNSWNAAPDGSDAERVQGIAATAELFEVLGVQAVRGRTFTASDGEPGAPCVTVLSDGFWRERLGAVKDAVGHNIRLDGRPCTIVGVMPVGFMFPNGQVRLWTPLALDPSDSRWGRESHPFLAIGRLTGGRTLDQAEAELDVLRAAWSERYPDHYAKGHFVVLRSLKDDLLGDLRFALLALLGAVGFVLLIVCANLAGLLLSRAEARRREVAIRTALGAARTRVVRQLLTEYLLLALVGGVLGLALARWMLPVLLAAYGGELPRGGTFTLDATVLVFTALSAMLSGVAFGLAPAVQLSRAGVQDALGADGRTATARRSSVRLQSVLVVSEVALSVVLITGAILLLRGYLGLRQLNPGFEPNGVQTFRLFTPAATYPTNGHVQRFYAALRERLAGLPGATSVGAISNLPLQSAGAPDDFIIENAQPPAPGEPARNARYLMVTPGALETLRVPLRRGRLLADRDVPGQPLVAVINETAARMYWRSEDPVGRRIRYYGDNQPWITIVGIVGDIRSSGLDRQAPPAIYVPHAQSPRPQYEGLAMTVVIRGTTNRTAPALMPSLRSTVTNLDPALPLANVLPMTTVVDRAADEPRFAAFLMAFFAASALALGAVGIYGVLAYAVERRRMEIGVRLALGADRGSIYRLVFARGLTLAVLGVIVGLFLAEAVTRMLSGLVYGLRPTPALTLTVVPLILLAAALAACAIPAWRATRVDPVLALRGE
jgi:putative ABC transport system permease protein